MTRHADHADGDVRLANGELLLPEAGHRVALSILEIHALAPVAGQQPVRAVAGWLHHHPHIERSNGERVEGGDHRARNVAKVVGAAGGTRAAAPDDRTGQKIGALPVRDRTGSNTAGRERERRGLDAGSEIDSDSWASAAAAAASTPAVTTPTAMPHRARITLEMLRSRQRFLQCGRGRRLEFTA